MMKVNKKAQGMLLEKALGILIAILVIAGLVYLIVLLVGSFSSNAQYSEQAKKQLASLSLAMSKMKEDETQSIYLGSPDSWEIVAYPNPDTGSARLEKCLAQGESCLCICPNAWTQNGLYDYCKKEQICEGFGKNIIVAGTSIKISATTTLKVNLKNNQYIIEEE